MPALRLFLPGSWTANLKATRTGPFHLRFVVSAFLAASLLAPPLSAQQLTSADPTQPSFTVKEIRPGKKIRILVYGDMRFTDPANTTDTWPKVRRWLAGKVATERPDALVVTGDIPFHGSNAADWNIFEQEAAAWHGLRVYPTVGNHEIIPQPVQGYQHYFAEFPHLLGYHVYSVLIGNVFLITLNSTEPIWPTGYQAEWLKLQLDHVPPQADFVMINVHVPLVADVQSEFIANIPSPDLVKLRTYLEQRASTMRARMIVVSGHIHNYERFERKGITYVISGGGGAKPYPVYMSGPDDLYTQSTFPNFHYLVFTFEARHVEATMYRVADPTASVFTVEKRDTFHLDLPEPGNPVR